MLSAFFRMNSSTADSDCASEPGSNSSPAYGWNAAWAKISRASLTHSSIILRSYSSLM